jgi:hypothetical protein
VHVPGFVAETGLAFGDWQTPPQQSAPLKQMSPFWMQYEDAMLQTPLAPHSPEQQGELLAQAFPAVVHDGVPVPPSVEPMGAHMPPTHVAVQQALPALGHGAPTVTHCVLPHVPSTPAPVQQSVSTAQPAPPLPHVAIEETHTLPRQRWE